MALTEAKTKDMLQYALDQTVVGVAHFDSDLKLKDWNRAFNALVFNQGELSEGMIERDIFTRHPPTSGSPDVDAELENHLDQTKNDANSAIEYKTTVGKWVRLNRAPAPDGGFFCICTDISEIKDKEREAQETRTFMSTLIDFLPGQVTVKDACGRYILVNRAVGLITGQDPEKMIGRTVEEISGATAATTLCERDAEALADPGETIDHTDILDLPGWGRRHVRSLKISPPPINGERYVVSITEDVSERVAAEETQKHLVQEAEKANLAKSVFLATMSHEIRTPLNGVLGMAQVMAFDDLSAAQRGRLEIIQQSGESLLAILNDVLDLSKIEAGKLTLETIEFDFRELISSAVKHYEIIAAEKGLTFNLDIDAADGAYLGDPTRLRQMLYNLVSNALKFTNAGSISVTAAYADQRVSLSVVDTGIGIPADKLGRLFLKFSQVDDSTTRSFGGTGLGLSICKELAELMGGSIAVESVEGRGSCFTLTLPLPRLSDGRASDPKSTVAEPEMNALRVLAAEDNPTNQLVLKTLLETGGVDVRIVENGAEAVEAWAAEPWDVILMDVQMPVMDGPTATLEIRRREAAEGRRRTPIIALTANAMAHQVEGYISIGMDGHVSKPIQINALFEALATLPVFDEASPAPSLQAGYRG